MVLWLSEDKGETRGGQARRAVPAGHRGHADDRVHYVDVIHRHICNVNREIMTDSQKYPAVGAYGPIIAPREVGVGVGWGVVCVP